MSELKSSPTSAHPAETHPTPKAPEPHKSAEATHASNKWMEKAQNKVKKWIGHGLRFSANEFSIAAGSFLITAGTAASILTGNPVPYALTYALGGVLAAGGVASEWDAMKNSHSKKEKGIFGVSKIAQTVGAPALAAATVLSAPLYTAAFPVATGMYLAGTALGARAMAHRSGGGNSGGGHGGD